MAGQLQTSLKFWTLVRDFENAPELNEDFVRIDPATTDRVFAVTDPDEDKLVFHVYHDILVSRQMPIYGAPTL